MGIFDFFKESGEDVIKEKDKSAAAEKSAEDLCKDAALAIQKYIENQKLGIVDLIVKFNAAEGKVTLTGEAPSAAAQEKAGLAAGNIKGISNVDNQISVDESAEETEVRYHDVQKGETLSSIAQKYYGNAGEYMKIFKANQPMLSDPDKIYPGQKLRIPA